MPRMTRVGAKICGLSTPETLAAAMKHGASHVGFVFFAKSPRNLDPWQAGGLGTPAEVRRVGVFVDPDDALLAHAIASARLDAVQLHGHETPDRVAAVRTRYRIETWKALPVKTRADIAASAAYTGAADRLLFDAKTPDHADLPGGMGLRFDWTLLEGYAHALPWALSGGLTADNVAEAVRVTRAPLVDTSSGVETAPGIKDVDKIAAFLQAVSSL